MVDRVRSWTSCHRSTEVATYTNHLPVLPTFLDRDLSLTKTLARDARPSCSKHVHVYMFAKPYAARTCMRRVDPGRPSYESRFQWLFKQLRSTAAWRSSRRQARGDVLCQRNVEMGCSNCSNPTEPLRHPRFRIRKRGTLDRGPSSQIWHRASFAPSQPQPHCISSTLLRTSIH